MFDWDLMGYNLYNVLGFESFTIRFHQNVQLGIGNQKKYILYGHTPELQNESTIPCYQVYQVRVFVSGRAVQTCGSD